MRGEVTCESCPIMEIGVRNTREQAIRAVRLILRGCLDGMSIDSNQSGLPDLAVKATNECIKAQVYSNGEFCLESLRPPEIE